MASNAPHAPGPRTGASQTAFPPLALIVAVGVVLAVRTLWLGRYPIVSADEGGWPLAVRTWVEHGIATFDYYQAPAYHWVLGLAYRWFGPTVVVGRDAAAIFDLLGLACFTGAAYRLTGDRRTAFWAFLLLGLDYTAVLTDRRAYIEPFQMFWMNALVFCYLGRKRSDLVGTAVATAGLLLTKASGGFILVALVAATLTDSPASDRAERKRGWLALCAGTGAALIIFAILCLHDPGAFMRGWLASMHGESVRAGNGPEAVPAVFRVGFIIIDPNFGFKILRDLSTDAPFGLVLATAATVKSLFERRATLIGWWFVIGLAAILVQAVWLENHLAVLYPAMALGGAWFLAEMDRIAFARHRFGVRWTWASILLVFVLLYDLGRFAGGVATTKEPTRPTVRWLNEHTQPADVVLAAPYIVMQRTAPEKAYWDLAPPYIPTADSLRRWHVGWVVVDRKEWIGTLHRLHADLDAFNQALAACCTPVSPDTQAVDVTAATMPPFEIYRVRSP
jgi:Dolichyl-phosphate-mannose-protein mannosyltransferase